MSLKHYAIEGNSLSMKGKYIQSLIKGTGEIKALEGKQGILFSNITLDKLIDEEVTHDQFVLSGDPNRSIRTFSSGEQKKALLKYLMSLNPEFIVLDNPFDCLDIKSVETLKQELMLIAKHTPIVQIFKRHNDIMPFISKVLFIENETHSKIYTKEEFEELHLHKEKAFINNSIPAPLKPFDNIPEVLVEFNGVSVSYEERSIIKDIHWKVCPGDFWHLVGPNGSGKTTMLSMIFGDNPKAFGQPIYLFGTKKGSGESVWDIKEKIGYFTPSLTERFHSSQSVEQMVISGLVDSVGLYLKPTDLQKKLAGKWLLLLGLADKANERFNRLSQVNQRLVMIARAMIKHPPLLILDEPSTGLNDYSASVMVQLIQKISAESSTAIIYVSHRHEEGLYPKSIFELKDSGDGYVGVKG